MLEDFSQQNSINFINLRSHLLKHGEETLYYDFDGHWTALGHERVAEGILNNSVFEEVISK
jgi:abortive infection bacteriophage resistance protein